MQPQLAQACAAVARPKDKGKAITKADPLVVGLIEYVPTAVDDASSTALLNLRFCDLFQRERRGPTKRWPFLEPVTLYEVKGPAEQKRSAQERKDTDEEDAGVRKGLSGRRRKGADRSVRRFVLSTMVMMVCHRPGNRRSQWTGAVAWFDRELPAGPDRHVAAGNGDTHRQGEREQDSPTKARLRQ
jgi:hypothetical protein